MIMQLAAPEVSTAALVRVPCPLCGGHRAVPENTVNEFSLEKCTDCSFVFVNPQPNNEQLAEIYTDRADEELIELYARIATPAVLAEYVSKLEWLETLVPQKGRLLDFACAAGYFFEQAQKRGWDAHGADLGTWPAKAAAARGLKNLHVGRLEDLGFAPASFDVVYAAQVFEHLPDPVQDLKELCRILKPGGLLYIDVPNYHTLPIMLGRDDFMLNTPPQHINYFTPHSLRSLLQSASLSDIRLSSAGGLKWENLFGRPISSDIAHAYGLVDSKSASAAPAESALRRLSSTAKQAVKRTFVQPVLYSGMKVGMNLIATARKPMTPGQPDATNHQTRFDRQSEVQQPVP